MRFLIHDFAGYAFPVQLSRELSKRGHTVTHVYLEDLQGPKGRLEHAEEDSDRLTIQGVRLARGFQKYSPWKRFFSQREYARAVKRIIGDGRFDVVLSGNAPIDIQAELLWHCRKKRIGFAHWVQDVYCGAIEFFLRRKLGVLGGPLSFPFHKLEQLVTAHSDATVVISPAFRDLLLKWGVPEAKITVRENWGPLEEVEVLARRNGWSEKHDLTGKTVLLYSGTIGLKHRPDLLYRLAQSLDSNCRLVIVSEGIGREYLEAMPKLETVVLFDFQPANQLSQVLASADVLIATLETNAGEFAVPSKVLTYLCAGRPILLGAPKSNLAASVVERSGAGFAANPDNPEEFIQRAKQLADDAGLRRSLGENARQYAERNFDISRIASAFEDILLSACPAGPVASPTVTEFQPEL